MPDAVFRFVLPLYGGFVILAIMIRRRLLVRETGRDPIVIRPFRESDTPHRYLESALSLGSLALAVDVLLNAGWPDFVRERLAIPALRASASLGWLGLTLVTVGLLLSAAAVMQMGQSWRIGIDREKPGPLVTGGLFHRVRHPIYSGMLLVAWGMAATTADALSVAVAAATWVGIPVQARLEEEFLLSLHREEYLAYRSRTGRFWPRSWRRR